MIHVLYAEDDLKYRELVRDFIENEGYELDVAKDGEEAIRLFFSDQDRSYDLVILDVMMPSIDGWEVCHTLRKESDVPIMMLTALDDEDSEIKGLNVGADDYVTKPFSYDVFMARVRSLTRKVLRERSREINASGIHINQLNNIVTIDGHVVDLSPKEYRLLIYLIQNNGLALSRTQILNAVWGYDYYGDTRTVDTHIKGLRAKLGEYSTMIRTVRCLGYELRINDGKESNDPSQF